MRAVLGVDAAWTAARPSGVALLVEGRRGWRCAGVAPSYASFLRLAGGEPVDWARPAGPGSLPPVAALLEAARALAPGAELAVAAADLPLAAGAITARRACDDALSRRYAARGLGVHSPSPARPGPVAAALHRGFAAAGFRLATVAHAEAPAPRPPPPARAGGEGGGGALAALAGRRRHLLEVYPHTAILALLGLEYRLPYKLARARRYWPAATPAERRARLVAAWSRVLRALRRDVADVALPLPAPTAAPAAGLKRLEDALDALVCAWAGIEFLAGRATAVGDATAAIWSPEPRRARAGREVAPITRPRHARSPRRRRTGAAPPAARPLPPRSRRG